jgi:Fic family protein
MFEASGKLKYDDTPQVLNYRQAMNDAIEELRRGRSLSTHLIKSLHHTLLTGVRFKGSLGEFRKDKVWIAEKKGDPIEKAIYIPPEHFNVAGYMDEIVKYIEQGSEHALIKAGLVHYQFEAVHPFDDGNGRIGRLLIPLILNYENSLTQPLLYISGYFDTHRDEYLAKLHQVDETGDYEEWLKFFFTSVTAQLKSTQTLINEIYGLYDKVKESFKVTKSPYLIPFLDFIFIRPVFSVPMILKSNIGTHNRTTINNLIDMFKEKKFVIDTETLDQRAKIYEFKPLIERLK